MSKQKALKITIEGSYKTHDNEVIDINNLTGYVPNIDEEIATMHVRGRYWPQWVKAATKKDGEKLYNRRIETDHQIFINDIQEVEHDFSYVGKNIKEMSYEELQDLAAAKDLRVIPLPKELSGVSLRQMRETAYIAYSENILGVDPKSLENDKRMEDGEEVSFINFAKLPALEVGGGSRRDTTQKLDNDEILEQEMKSTDVNGGKSDLTIKDLKQIADVNKIQYHPKIGFDALYAKIYGGA